MYEVFDEFLARDTWHAGDEVEEQAFHKALARVVIEPDFNPDDMGQHMRSVTGTWFGDPHSEAIERHIADAWAVRRHYRYKED